VTAKDEGPPSPWKIREDFFPHYGDSTETLSFLLRYAILAPSSHNTQPWKFALGEEEIGIYADRGRWLRVADPDRRELYISLGCALENLLIAVEHFGYGHEAVLFPEGPDSDLAASVKLLPRREPSAQRPVWMFPEITSRHTNHGRYEARAIPSDVRRGLEACCADDGVRLFLIDDPAHRRRVDLLVTRADAFQFARPEYRQELEFWIGEGVFGLPWLLAKLGQLAASYLEFGNVPPRPDADLLMHSPLFGVLTSVRDDAESQLRVGQAFERIYLTASAQSIGLQPLSQAVQVPAIREELTRLLPAGAGSPQQPFRLGYAERVQDHTPRRPLSEVVR
jgi:hypothetical protein